MSEESPKLPGDHAEASGTEPSAVVAQSRHLTDATEEPSSQSNETTDNAVAEPSSENRAIAGSEASAHDHVSHDHADEEYDYESDETSATLFLRAVFTLLAGGLLVWVQWNSRIIAAQQWERWVQAAVLANFVLPLGVVWLFFGQGLRTPDWMRDPRHNAWAYGWNLRPFRQHAAFALLALIVMLPLLWFASRDPNTREAYHQTFLPPTQGAANLARVLIGLTIYMLCWEWFFRGFLLFGMAQGVGPIAAIVLQALVFTGAHIGKPMPETVGALAGGLILGMVAWRTKSFFPAFYAHLLIHIAWVLLM